jgi:hypothetical protein
MVGKLCVVKAVVAAVPVHIYRLSLERVDLRVVVRGGERQKRCEPEDRMPELGNGREKKDHGRETGAAD